MATTKARLARALACSVAMTGCGDADEPTDTEVDDLAIAPVVWVSSAGDDARDGRSPRRAKRTIQGAIDALAAEGRRGTVRVLPGEYPDAISVENFRHLRVLGVGRDEVALRFATTRGWNVGGYGETRRAALRVVGCDDVTFRGLTFDFKAVHGDFVAGALVWNSSGSFARDAFVNMSADGYYELTAYVSAPDFSASRRARVDFIDDEFVRTGRVGVIFHSWVYGEVSRSSFRADGDFGYGVEVASQAAAIVHGNDIGGYRTVAATDGSASAGVLVDNSFTADSPHVDKRVIVRANHLHDNGYGVSVGNASPGLAGDVDVRVELEANLIVGSALAGVQVTDAGRASGSSVTVASRANIVSSRDAAGYSVFTAGDGDVRLSIESDAIVGNDTGVEVYPDRGPSVIAVSVRDSSITGNDTGVRNLGPSVLDARRVWWGSSDGPFDAAGSVEVTARNCAVTALARRRNAVAERARSLGDPVSDGVSYCGWLRIAR